MKKFRPSPCIKVPLILGEKYRRLLLKNSLLELKLMPRKLGDQLLLPVTEPPEAVDEHMRICMAVFEEYPSRRRESIGSYDIIGSIAILPPMPIEKARSIGDAILKAHPAVKSVYMREKVEGDYRVLLLHHVAGEKTTKTLCKEYGVKMIVDVSKMYVNPSLSYEHHRVSEKAVDGEIVLDMFAGAGGFSLHTASKRKVYMISMDINQNALKALKESISLNKLKGLIDILHSDARIVDYLFREAVFNRVLMNLPHSSIEFLEKACKAVKPGGIIIIYLISASSAEAERAVMKEALRRGCNPIIVFSRRVLDYAPGKYIFVVEIKVKA